ncbi:hypothetical protein [Nitrosovibrio sp. Nv4]|uniref:hypothetical protein n=1 Tax=Nitrosovibrio sp. Nv4 TaxID=1945880 RepID=UPI000BCBAC5F|nr:hypothetical protein [Nitrosovibrio sp. Nv4]SOD41747.1 hypothetical protein SAMN06298226_2049 [Nitrosovibrio sp. Nv4]
MDVNRRNLMKGVLTSGTLLALGIPPGVYANNATAGGAGRLGLLLGNTRVDAAFAAGIRTAYAAHVKHAVKEGGAAGHGAPEVVKLKGGLLTDYEEVARLLEKSRDTRWIAVMDDGSAAVFTELARNAGAKLLLLGSHVSSGSDRTQDISGDIPELRHVWAAASPLHSAAGILALQLITNQSDFSIVENFFSGEHAAEQAQAGSTTASKFPPDFLTYRLDGLDAIHLHCSGLSPSDGCKSLGWNPAGAWVPVSQEIPARKATASARRGDGSPQSAGWVESVGYAVMAAALGAGALGEPCSARAFVHRPAIGRRREPVVPAERLTSFVIDLA